MSNTIELIYHTPTNSDDNFKSNKWLGALNTVSCISFTGVPITKSDYFLNLYSADEELLSCSSFPSNLTLDYYYVLVKYGRYARFEPRLIKSNSVIRSLNSANNKNDSNTLFNVIVINNNHKLAEEFVNYPNDKERFDSIDKAIQLHTSGHQEESLKLLNELFKSGTKINIDVAYFLSKYENTKNSRINALNVSNTELLISEIFLFDGLIQTVFEKSVALLYLKNFIPSRRYQDCLYLSRYLNNNSRDHFCNILYSYHLGKPISFNRIKRFSLPTMWNYTVMNSSIINIDSKFYMTLRTVNYLHVAPNYISNDQDRQIRTVTYFCEMNSDFELIKKYRIINKVDYIQHRHTAVKCIEDLRIFHYNDEFWCIGTGIDTHYQQTHQMVIGHLNIDNEKGEAIIDKLYVLEYSSWKCQKNWIPFVTKNSDGSDKLQIIYKYEPLTFLEINLDCLVDPIYCKGDKAIITRTKEIVQPIYCGSFRGSAIPFRYKNNWIILVHCSRWLNGTKNTYVHRFLELDDNFVIKRVSPMFQTSNHHMEYVMGAVYDSQTKEIYLSLSENDSNGGVGSISQELFEEMFYDPVEYLTEQYIIRKI